MDRDDMRWGSDRGPLGAETLRWQIFGTQFIHPLITGGIKSPSGTQSKTCKLSKPAESQTCTEANVLRTGAITDFESVYRIMVQSQTAFYPPVVHTLSALDTPVSVDLSSLLVSVYPSWHQVRGGMNPLPFVSSAAPPQPLSLENNKLNQLLSRQKFRCSHCLICIQVLARVFFPSELTSRHRCSLLLPHQATASKK